MSRLNPFQQELRARWKPFMAAKGFRGGPVHYLRTPLPYLHCVYLQRKSDGSAYSVNLGMHLDFIPVESGEPLERLTQPSCGLMVRLTPNWKGDQWWSVADPVGSVGTMIELFDRVGNPFLNQFREFPEPFVNITPSEVINLDDRLRAFFPMGFHQSGLCLLLCQVHKYLDNKDMVREFADIGLQYCNEGNPIAIKAMQRKLRAFLK